MTKELLGAFLFVYITADHFTEVLIDFLPAGQLAGTRKFYQPYFKSRLGRYAYLQIQYNTGVPIRYVLRLYT